jgi:Zn-dependent protease/CBS domain-containing protein
VSGQQAQPPTAGPSTPRPPGTFKIGTIAGSDVLVSSSWFVVAGLIAIVTAPLVEREHPGLGPLAYVAGFAFAVVLYLSVLLHEASHALVAKHYGFEVSAITLHFLGGLTTIEAEARKPRQEFWIAVVGPLSSLGVGLVAWGLRYVMPDGLLLTAVAWLAYGNLVVGAMNLVPGLPLDGGRVLKAGVWKLTGSAHRGTVVAAWGGRVTAIAVLLWPVLSLALTDNQPDVFDFILVFVIGLFLWNGATAALQAARIKQRLPHLVARNLARRTLSVPEDLPLAEAVRRAREAQAGAIVTVTGSGRPVGVVNEAALMATPEERRPWLAISTVARGIDDGLALPVSIAGEDLVRAITRAPATEYLLVEEDGSVYGVLTAADVDAAFRAAPW